MSKEIQKYKTHSENETIQLGYRIYRNWCRGYHSLAKIWEPVNGFHKGIAAGLGISRPITSPTFTLVNSYTGKYILHHSYVYLIDSSDELGNRMGGIFLR